MSLNAMDIEDVIGTRKHTPVRRYETPACLGIKRFMTYTLTTVDGRNPAPPGM